MSAEKQVPVSASALNCETDLEGHCATCGDEAQRVRVLSISQMTGTALVEMADTIEEVDVSLVDEVAPGDLLLVHAGVAIGVDRARERSEGEVCDV